ncbi:hypothetical protein PQD80_gp65 [Arthrobacter phage Lizalica]|uniref:Uncharacterized protein n=1 Tax=Arthrobacter phage Lizalica TaxID=2832319 RepID=A0AA49B3F7_9CAUD|nr:hypothetical protein PQD80_gp65 [Arthrobacter phage Lizalica]UIW13549.1 hypothetical protein SEA_LIZALICA_65 [Arthrobacter phage Lizalica]
MEPKPESPVCTCITAYAQSVGIRYVRVFDPFCQIKRHAARGTTALDPTYPKAAKE